MPKGRLGLLVLLLGGITCGAIPPPRPAPAADDASPAPLELAARDRVPAPSGDGPYEVREKTLRWDPRQTAVIICDMWDQHWCLGASRRVAEMAPRMNRLVAEARSRGVLVVHAPSSCMDHYRDHPARARAQSAPAAENLPPDIGQWCQRIPAEEAGVYPLDQSDGGCDCQPRCPDGSPWQKQIDSLEILPEDAISDSGEEIWNLLDERGIDNVMLVGVHTNMCVLGRPFGLRNMARYGKNVVLVRDMTDTMYNSRAWPHVSHFRGTDLIVEHIEKFVSPTITSQQLLGPTPFRFAGDLRPQVVLAIAEDEYKTDRTLPPFAQEVLERQLDLTTTLLLADPGNPHVIGGLAEALAEADLLVLSIRRRALPESDLVALRKYLEAGGALVALRTSSHAFDARGQHPEGHAEWPHFDAEVLGGHYTGHHPDGPLATVTIAEGAESHPILSGVQTPFTSRGSLYRSRPLADSATPLLAGSIPDAPGEPVAWVNRYGRSRVFYTSLGHADDFENPQFVRLLAHAICWTLDRPAPRAAREEK